MDKNELEKYIDDIDPDNTIGLTISNLYRICKMQQQIIYTLAPFAYTGGFTDNILLTNSKIAADIGIKQFERILSEKGKEFFECPPDPKH